MSQSLKDSFNKSAVTQLMFLFLFFFAAGTTNAATSLQSAAYPPYMSAQYCVLNTNADRTNLTQNVEYACSRADCTPLYPGSSCASLTLEQNASYSFNAYFQFQNQDPSACFFQGLGQITTTNPSTSTCRFIVGLVSETPAASSSSIASTSRRYSRVLVFTFIAISSVALLWLH